MHKALQALMLILTLMVVLFGADPVLAQAGATSASIEGIVVDEQSGVIGGATITARNLSTGVTREGLTGEDGVYSIVQLPPGFYEVQVRVEGFKGQTAKVELALGTILKLRFSLGLAAVPGEIIEVKADSLVDERKTSSTTNVDSGRIDNLPINQRNFLQFSLTAARVTPDRLSQQSTSATALAVAATSGLAVNGQTARANNVTIDGIDNNDPFSGAVRSTYSQEAVQEFQILTDSYAAEFGRAVGGIVNIVTKPGTNQFHGSLFSLIRTDELSARNAFASFKPELKQYQYGASLSGPIKKDRAFFFLSFERISFKQNNIITISDAFVAAANRQQIGLVNGPSPVGIGQNSLLARADLKISENDNMIIRYNGGFELSSAFQPFGALIGNTAGGVRDLDDNNITISNTYINPGLNLINETRFLYGRRNQAVVPIDDQPATQILAPEGNILFGSPFLLPQDRQERLYQIVNNVSIVRSRHQIKFGGDFFVDDVPTTRTPGSRFGQAAFASIDFAAMTGNPAFPFFTALQAFDPASRTPAQLGFLTLLSGLAPVIFPGFPAGVPLASLPIPGIFGQGFGNGLTSVTRKSGSLFIQDDFKLRPNLLIKAGLRMDVSKISSEPNTPITFGPRFAISYQPSRFQKLHLHGAYGIFSSVTTIGISLGVVSVNSQKVVILPFPFSIPAYNQPKHRFPASDVSEVPPGVQFTPQLSLSAQVNRDLTNSYAQQVNTGFDYFADKNTVISANYNMVRGLKVASTRNINPVVRPSADLLTSLVNGRVDPSRGDVFDFSSGFDSYYHALTVSINRRLANRFSFLAHYTWSKGIDDAIDSVGTLQETQDPLNIVGERGLSVQDVRSRFVASGTWELSYTNNPFLRDFNVSTIVTLESGRTYNLLAGTDLNRNGDNGQGDRPLGLGRNVGLTPGYANVDLRVTRKVALGEQRSLVGFIEFFNLFNRTNINEVSRIFPPDANGNFILPPREGSRFGTTPSQFRSSFPERQIQFGFRFRF
jgi:hypothetical protein